MKWILDTDCGIDDLQAIMIALHYLDVVAITGVNGNTTVDNVVKNVSIITGVLGKKVPIYKGMNRPMMREPIIISDIHGSDGFGGVQENWLEYADQDNIMKEHAVNAIIKHINAEFEAGNEVGVFTIGPGTNLAMALRLDSTIVDKISKYYCMGGTVNGWGNITLTGEFNFISDPEAAKIGIESIPFTHLLPWETAYNFIVNDEGKHLAN